MLPLKLFWTNTTWFAKTINRTIATILANTFPISFTFIYKMEKNVYSKHQYGHIIQFLDLSGLYIRVFFYVLTYFTMKASVVCWAFTLNISIVSNWTRSTIFANIYTTGLTLLWKYEVCSLLNILCCIYKVLSSYFNYPFHSGHHYIVLDMNKLD